MRGLGRDIALRCPEGAARRPYLSDPIIPEKDVEVIQELGKENQQ